MYYLKFLHIIQNEDYLIIYLITCVFAILFLFNESFAYVSKNSNIGQVSKTFTDMSILNVDCISII